MKRYDRDRGSLIVGTMGSVIVDRDGYEIYDPDGHNLETYKASTVQTSSTDTTGKDSMTDAHFANLIAGIRTGERLNAPIEVGAVAVTMLQLSNYAWETGRALTLDPSRNDAIVGDAAALAHTRREYAPGWEPVV